MANNYKTDTGKAPVVSAVFIPFRRTLLALAEMMERQKVRHQLQGAKDPFQEWRQLPEGKDRLMNAGGRHALCPWDVNTKDRVGDHPGDLHILHALWGLMAAHEKHLEELDDQAHSDAYADGEPFPADPCCGAADAASTTDLAPIHGPAGADWRERSATVCCPDCGHSIQEHDCGFCYHPGCSCPVLKGAK